MFNPEFQFDAIDSVATTAINGSASQMNENKKKQKKNKLEKVKSDKKQEELDGLLSKEGLYFFLLLIICH